MNMMSQFLNSPDILFTFNPPNLVVVMCFMNLKIETRNRLCKYGSKSQLIKPFFILQSFKRSRRTKLRKEDAKTSKFWELLINSYSGMLQYMTWHQNFESVDRESQEADTAGPLFIPF